jgi:WS/DGAT/MGAT family acyltransferase
MMELMFLLTEKQEVPCHVGAILIFRKPRTRGAQVAGAIVDAYRRLQPRPPFNRVPVSGVTGMLEWREVEQVDPVRHVLHLRLPPPGSDRQLHQLVADLHEPLLDRHRPGWKIYVIDGLEGGRFAIYHKCHHSLADGESGMAILRGSMSTSPQDRRIRPLAPPANRRQRSARSSQTRNGSDDDATGLVDRMLASGKGSLQAVARALEGVRGFSSTEPRAYTAPQTPMNEPIAAARSVTHFVLPLQRMKAVARAWDATLNDVALAILDEAMHRQLRAMQRVPDHPLVAICPVLLQAQGSKRATNRLSTIFPPLGPVTARVDRRLKQIHANTRAAREQLDQLGRDTAYAYTVATYAVTQALAAARPASFGLPMLLGNVVVSNVRGPAEPLYLNRARLEEIFPVSMLAIAVGLNITLLSYDGRVIFGITANGAALPDVEPLARHALDAFEELEQATAKAKGRGARRPRATSGRRLTQSRRVYRRRSRP